MFTSLPSKSYETALPKLSGDNFVSRSIDEGTVAHIDHALNENGLELIQSTMSQYPLFSALSLCLFKNQSYEGLMIRKVRETINELSMSDKLGLRLHPFKNNPTLLSNFTSKPYEERYHKYVFDLVSLAFEVKVIVCSLPGPSTHMSETIYANKFKRTIRLMDLSDGNYQALFLKGTFQKDQIQEGTIEDVYLVLSS